MKRTTLPLILVLFLAHTTPAPAADPAWWAARGVITNAPQSNLSPATVGQAKWMVAQALAELQVRLSPPDYQAIATDVGLVTNLAPPQSPEEFENLKGVLLLGQLKALAAPFYIRLNTYNPTWLATERTTNGTNNAGSIFPWTTATTDDANKAAATIGQLKAVFSLRFEILNIDSDSDGLTNAEEYQLGTNPNNPDSDLDGILDGADATPLANNAIADPDGENLIDGFEIPTRSMDYGRHLTSRIPPFPLTSAVPSPPMTVEWFPRPHA